MWDVKVVLCSAIVRPHVKTIIAQKTLIHLKLRLHLDWRRTLFVQKARLDGFRARVCLIIEMGQTIVSKSEEKSILRQEIPVGNLKGMSLVFLVIKPSLVMTHLYI